MSAVGRGDGSGLELLKGEALRLVALGYVVHPIARKGIRYRDRQGVERVTNGKGPIVPGWQTKTLTGADLLREIDKPTVSGLGMRAGPLRTVLDFDGDGWQGAFKYLASDFPEIEDGPLVRTGSGKVHAHIVCEDMPTTFTSAKFSRPDLRAVVELRGRRSNCVLPPTVHPASGLPYSWIRDPECSSPPRIAFTRIHGWLCEWGMVQRVVAQPRTTAAPAEPVTVGEFAYRFVEKGWPLGCPSGISQRDAILRVTRNLLSAGWEVGQVYNAVWKGIELSPWDESKGPWTREEVQGIVEDISRRPAPPLKPRAASIGGGTPHRGGLRVIRVGCEIHRRLPREAVPCRK